MTPDAPIRYGMFIMPFHPPRQAAGAVLRRRPGADRARPKSSASREFWIGEHHTMKYENIVMPEIFIARALGETQRIRLGPAPVCLQQHHPAHVACRLAFLDHLSKGRLNLCFGAGSVTADQELYGCDPKNGAEMVDEAIEMILYLWTHDPPYEVQGKYWPIKLAKNVDHETAHRLHSQAAAKAASADRRAGHEPQFAQHEDGRAARAPAVRPLPDSGQRDGRHLEHLRGGRRSRPAARRTAPTGRWPARSFWPTRPRKPCAGPAPTRWARTTSTSAGCSTRGWVAESTSATWK